jgi:hypothetical protein
MYLSYNFSYDCGSLIVYLIFIWSSKFNHVYILYFDNHQSLIMYFIFQRSLKFDHVSYILIVVEV